MPGKEAFGEGKEGTLPAKEGTVSPAPEGGPATQAQPQPAPVQDVRIAPQPKEIIAPEAIPVAEQAAARAAHLGAGPPVLPDGGGVPIAPESVPVQWGEEAAGTAVSGRTGENAQVPAGKTALIAAAATEKPAGDADAPAGRPAGRSVRPPGHMFPYYPPLRPQFRATLADIRRFIGAGELMLLAGGVVFLAIAIMGFGAAIMDGRHTWTTAKVVDDVVRGLLGLVLSAGSFFIFMMSRWKLRGAFRRNDLLALQRRLIVACAAGTIFGLVFGGVFMLLAYIKVDELPSVQADRTLKKPKPAMQKSD